MKHLFIRFSLCCILLSVIASCEKVSSLSDSAKIEHIAVADCNPSKAIFAEPVVKGTAIELPLVYGKYLFPLTVTLDVQVEAGCTQLLGFDNGRSFTFDNLAHERKLYTVAASGATTTWTIRIVDAMSNESAEVVRAQATAPAGSDILVAPTAFINKFDATVTFQGAGTAKYPVTVVPDITLAEGAVFTGGGLPGSLTFESNKDVKKYTVESASGRTKEWSFQAGFVAAKDNSDTADLSEDQVRRLTVLADQVTFIGEGVRLTEVNARFKNSTTGGELDLMVTPDKAGSLVFPVKAMITIPVDKQSVLFGTPADNMYEFSSYTDKKQVWVADKVSGLIKCWTLVLCPEMNTDIKSYKVTTYTCAGLPDIVVDKEHVEIDNVNSRVLIPVSNPDGTPIAEKSTLNLNINMELGLYDGSKCTTTVTKHTYITNVGTLSVATDNGLQKRTWTVYLQDKNASTSDNKDIANISIVGYSSKGNRMVLSASSYVANNDTRTITLSIKQGVDAFPLVITQKTIKTTKGTSKIFPAAVADYDTPLVFESLNSVKDFTVQAEDGTTAEWKLCLTSTVTGKTAEIESILVTDASNGVRPTDITVDKTARHASIVVDGIPPFDFAVQFVTTDNATVSGLENGLLTFNSYADRLPVTVTSQDGSLTTNWTIGIERPEKIQIGNSDFELWGTFKDVNTNTYTINPTPGLGYGWATANLMIGSIGVQGTMPVKRTDGKLAAEMTTADQNTIFKGYVIAAGTLFTGIFKLNIANLTEPRKMTKFGIPFTARPTSFDMEVKYTPGTQLKQATVGSDGKYSIHDIDGIDKAHIWIELLRWEGTGAIDYDGNPSDKVTVLGRTELVIDGANNPYSDWTEVNLPMHYDVQYDALKPTHIVVVFSSSKEGDKFIGAIGSKLCADHFHINY